MSGREFHLPIFISHPNYEVKMVQTSTPLIKSIKSCLSNSDDR